MTRKDYNEISRLFGIELAKYDFNKDVQTEGAWEIIRAFMSYAVEENPRFDSGLFTTAVLDSRNKQYKVKELLNW